MNAQVDHAQLKAAYDRTKLKKNGISFEWAIEQPIFVMCLTRIAESMQKPYVPLPKHAVTPPRAYKDE